MDLEVTAVIAPEPQAMRFLIAVVDRAATQSAAALLKKERLALNMLLLANGTVGTDLMALLGLDSREKTFVGCVVPKRGCRQLLGRMSDALGLRRRGVGIAFSMILTGINSAAMYAAVNGHDLDEREGDGMSLAGSARYCLITATINEGHVDELMQAARAAGARGGTVLRARRVLTDGDDDVRFIAGGADKDIVLIVAPRDAKNEIMKSLSEACGANSNAQGMFLSFSIEDAVGLGDDN